ncbi:MAG TPA: glycoside hydrolase family 36 protein [Acidimicrobiia bacterium]|nr:glycoside hydrolase family 36 protein [Acidimicrobiia bacterium]
MDPLEVEVALDADGVVRWRIRNAAQEPVAIDAVGIVWDEAVPAGPTAVVVHGYQSWSPTRLAHLGLDEDPSHTPGTFPMLRSAYHADPSVTERGELRSEQVTVLRGAADLVLVGFLDGRTHEGTVRLRPADAGVATVEAQAWFGGAVLAPGEERELHPFVRRTGADAGALLEQWAASVGAAAGARVGAPYQVGWCSWYHYFHDVTERALRTNLGVATEWPFEVFQLDDGYQAHIGDWLETNERFPSGVDGAGAAIAAAGFVPGLWLAPFIASPASRVAREHPEWFARDDDGAPLVTMFHEKWGGVMWQLDVTRPDVLDHLRTTAATLRAMGYEYLKLDFTFSSTGPGRYDDATQTPAQRLRAGYDAVRAGLGDDGFLLACGCPLGPVVGVVDAMRIGPDVAPSWEIEASEPGLPGYEAAAPSTRGAWSATLARSFQHRNLWLNDPDCVMLRSSHTNLEADAARAWALAVGQSGGLALVSDDLTLLDASSRALLDEVIALGRAADDEARAGRAPRCDDLFDPAGPRRLTAGGRTLAIDDLARPRATLR